MNIAFLRIYFYPVEILAYTTESITAKVINGIFNIAAGFIALFHNKDHSSLTVLRISYPSVPLITLITYPQSSSVPHILISHPTYPYPPSLISLLPFYLIFIPFIPLIYCTAPFS